MGIRKPIPNSPSSSSSSSSSSLYTFSSTDSSSSSSRCQGLDLLVKAIHQVTAGSIIGVPYIQKRVLTRRRRRKVLTFDNFFSLPKRQQRKRLKTVPNKYQHSVFIQSSKPKPKTKTLPRSAKICQQFGS